jgi:hypothetical protein
MEPNVHAPHGASNWSPRRRFNCSEAYEHVDHFELQLDAKSHDARVVALPTMPVRFDFDEKWRCRQVVRPTSVVSLA